MGNRASKPGGPSKPRPAVQWLLSANLEASFLVLSPNTEAEVFEFIPEESFMVAYAINRQTSPRFQHRTLGDTTVLDARQIATALIDKAVIPKQNVMLLTATKDEDLCVSEGMKRSFISQARRVGERGIFVCHFSGHGIQSGSNEWGLAPADFDHTYATLITGLDLNHWLQEADCKAAKVLFTLDCCYSGGLGDEMTMKDPFGLRDGLYVLSACTAFETSLVIGPLRHSIFAYFLAYALRVVKVHPGKLPLHKVAEECGVLCTALSSLLISYNPTFGLKFGTMQPVLRYFDLEGAGSAVDSLVQQSLGRILSVEEASMCQLGAHSFMLKYQRGEREDGPQLSPLCEAWLMDLGAKDSVLEEFARRTLLKDEVLLAAICSVMWSVASIQLAEDKKTVGDRSIFLLGFLHASAAFSCHSATPFTLSSMQRSLDFYQAVLETNKVNDKDIQAMIAEIDSDLNQEELSIDPTKTLQPSFAQQEVKKSQNAVFQSIAASWWVPLSPEEK